MPVEARELRPHRHPNPPCPQTRHSLHACVLFCTPSTIRAASTRYPAQLSCSVRPRGAKRCTSCLQASPDHLTLAAVVWPAWPQFGFWHRILIASKHGSSSGATRVHPQLLLQPRVGRCLHRLDRVQSPMSHDVTTANAVSLLVFRAQDVVGPMCR